MFSFLSSVKEAAGETIPLTPFLHTQKSDYRWLKPLGSSQRGRQGQAVQAKPQFPPQRKQKHRCWTDCGHADELCVQNTALHGRGTSFLLSGCCSLKACFISARLQAELLQVLQQRFSVVREACDARAQEKKFGWKAPPGGRLLLATWANTQPSWQVSKSQQRGYREWQCRKGFPLGFPPGGKGVLCVLLWGHEQEHSKEHVPPCFQ